MKVNAEIFTQHVASQSSPMHYYTYQHPATLKLFKKDQVIIVATVEYLFLDINLESYSMDVTLSPASYIMPSMFK